MTTHTPPDIGTAPLSAEQSDPSVLSDAGLLRYSRQILLDGWDLEAQLRLKVAHVGVIGLGGLGTPVTQTLVRAGVGRLTLADFDRIDASNLQRQTLFFTADVGKSKVSVAAEQLRQHNPHVQISAIDQQMDTAQLLTTFAECDLLLDCTDIFAIRDQINRAAVQLRMPLLSAAAIADYGQLALFEPDRGCYRCLFSNQPQTEQSCATSGVLTSTTAVLGNLQAHAALEWLGRQHNPLRQKLLLWQGASMSQRLIGYRVDPDCPVCQA